MVGDAVQILVEEVGVDVQRHRSFSVAQHPLHRFDIGPGADGQARGRMSKVVWSCRTSASAWRCDGYRPAVDSDVQLGGGDKCAHSARCSPPRFRFGFESKRGPSRGAGSCRWWQNSGQLGVWSVHCFLEDQRPNEAPTGAAASDEVGRETGAAFAGRQFYDGT